MTTGLAALCLITAACLAAPAGAEIYVVADHQLVEAGASIDEARGAAATAPAPPVRSRAVGASNLPSRALPEPGVVAERAGSVSRRTLATPVSTRNLRSDYGPLISAAAEVYHVDENLLRAVIWRESHFDHHARSPAGAKGLMQLMPGTARSLGVVDSFDPMANVAGGTRYLRTLMQRYPGNIELALAAYNAGAGAVQRYGGIPPYRETRAYVAAIRSHLAAALARGSMAR